MNALKNSIKNYLYVATLFIALFGSGCVTPRVNNVEEKTIQEKIERVRKLLPLEAVEENHRSSKSPSCSSSAIQHYSRSLKRYERKFLHQDGSQFDVSHLKGFDSVRIRIFENGAYSLPETKTRVYDCLQIDSTLNLGGSKRKVSIVDQNLDGLQDKKKRSLFDKISDKHPVEESYFISRDQENDGIPHYLYSTQQRNDLYELILDKILESEPVSFLKKD